MIRPYLCKKISNLIFYYTNLRMLWNCVISLVLLKREDCLPKNFFVKINQVSKSSLDNLFTINEHNMIKKIKWKSYKWIRNSKL